MPHAAAGSASSAPGGGQKGGHQSLSPHHAHAIRPQVEFPDGRRTLCLLPARFHKKLWVKNGNFLIVEEAEDAEGRVTGQIVAVLFAEHVKELKRMAGVWCAGEEAGRAEEW